MDWFNKDWKKYLEKGDKVLFHTVIDKSVVKADSWLIAFIVGLFPGFWGFLVSFVQWENIFVSLYLGFVCFALIGLLVRFLLGMALNATQYILTAKGVYKVSGLINKRIKFVPYKRITDAEMTRGIIGHIFDTANIGICTASGNMNVYVRGTQFSQNEIDIRGIKDYKKVRQLILGKIK